MSSRGWDQTKEGISAYRFCMLLLKPYHHHQEFHVCFFGLFLYSTNNYLYRLSWCITYSLNSGAHKWYRIYSQSVFEDASGDPFWYHRQSCLYLCYFIWTNGSSFNSQWLGRHSFHFYGLHSGMRNCQLFINSYAGSYESDMMLQIHEKVIGAPLTQLPSFTQLNSPWRKLFSCPPSRNRLT